MSSEKLHNKSDSLDRASEVEYVIIGNYAKGVTKFTFESEKDRDEYFLILKDEYKKDSYKAEVTDNIVSLDSPCCEAVCGEDCISKLLNTKKELNENLMITRRKPAQQPSQ